MGVTAASTLVDRSLCFPSTGFVTLGGGLTFGEGRGRMGVVAGVALGFVAREGGVGPEGVALGFLLGGLNLH